MVLVVVLIILVFKMVKAKLMTEAVMMVTVKC